MHMADALPSPAVGGTLWAISGGLIVLDGGKVVADGPTRELLNDETLMLEHGLERPHILRHSHPHCRFPFHGGTGAPPAQFKNSIRIKPRSRPSVLHTSHPPLPSSFILFT